MKTAVLLIILAFSGAAAYAQDKGFDKILHVTSVEAETGSRVHEGTGGTYTWHKMLGQVDGRGYAFRVHCAWQQPCDYWLSPGDYPARWGNSSTLQVEYHDDKGRPRKEWVDVVDIYGGATDGAGTPAPGVGPTPVPRVVVTSTPDGADIEIDGSFVGNTPSTVEVAVGEHSVVVKKAGYEPWERKLKVSGGDIKLSAELEKKREPGK